MAKIPLTSGFTLIPEGTYVFEITKVEYKEAFGKLAITLVTQDGSKHVERFSLQNKSGSTNDGALSAFSFFAKTALDDFDATEIEPEDLIGHFIKAEVVHTEGESQTFANLGQKEPADGFDDNEYSGHKNAVADTDVDLDDLLGL